MAFENTQIGQGIPQGGFGLLAPQGQSPAQTTQPGFLQGFMQRLQSDPALQQAVLAASTQLMQPIQPGQSPIGQIGQAAMTGMQTMSRAKADKRKGEMEERKLAAEEKKVGLMERGVEIDEQKAITADKSQKFIDDLRSAEAEFTRWKMENPQQASGAGSARLQWLDSVAKAYHNTFPDKFKTFNEAKVYVHRLEGFAKTKPREQFIADFVQSESLFFGKGEEGRKKAMEAAEKLATMAGLQSQEIAPVAAPDVDDPYGLLTE